ncbi:hypothetical protein [Zavarzinia sp.]|uniref:hypothetical protein n=1 Tax=Zavarzinia sp. TaxID=2027920 RepID=UPI0035617784
MPPFATRPFAFLPAVLLASVLSAGGPAHAATPTESDRILLEQAARACQARDFRALFDAMAMSAVVRQRYSAPEIELTVVKPGGTVEMRKIDLAHYTDFPVAKVDEYYKPAKASTEGDDYVLLEFNQSQSDQISIEWTRVRFVGPSQGGDDLGTPVTLDGRPYDPMVRTDGQLLLEPTADCWTLIADSRLQGQ